MSTELFFVPASSQNATSGFQGEKIGAGGAGRSDPARAAAERMNNGQPSFWASLQQALRDLNPHQPPASASRPSASAGQLQNGCDPPGDCFAPASTEGLLPQMPANEETSPEFSCENFAALIHALEAMGFYRPAGGSDWQSSAVGGEMDGLDFADIKLLIDRIRQNQSVPAAELKAGFQWLQEFITTLLAGNSTSPADGSPGSELAPDRAADLVRLNHWIQGLSAGHEVADRMGGEVMGPDAPDEPSSGAVSSVPRSAGPAGDNPAGPPGHNAAGPADNNPFEIKANYKADGTLQLAEPSGPVSSAEDRKQADAVKFQHAAAFKNEVADASGRKELQDGMPDAKILSQSEKLSQISTELDRPPRNGAEMKPESHSQIQPASAGFKPEAADLSERPIQTSSGEEPPARALQESQPAKQGDFKVDTGIGEEGVGKVLKSEAGTSDSSLFNSSGQNAEKAAETGSAPKAAAAGHNSLPTQTLDQIVQRASIHLSGGQHEARIDLKPDFLGHVRMQVVAENHQVTLKILTEHGFVKDMIEHNIHQLKADLQQQGMTIDKLEVSVSRDPDEYGNPKEKLFGSRPRPEAAVHRGHERPADEKRKDPRRTSRRADGSVTVDYFA